MPDIVSDSYLSTITHLVVFQFYRLEQVDYFRVVFIRTVPAARAAFNGKLIPGTFEKTEFSMEILKIRRTRQFEGNFPSGDRLWGHP